MIITVIKVVAIFALISLVLALIFPDNGSPDN